MEGCGEVLTLSDPAGTSKVSPQLVSAKFRAGLTQRLCTYSIRASKFGLGGPKLSLHWFGLEASRGPRDNWMALPQEFRGTSFRIN